LITAGSQLCHNYLRRYAPAKSNDHHRAPEQGQAIVLLALIMAALLVFAALAIDGGNTYVERRRAQNAADAAALAGARALWLHFSAGDSSETGIRVDMNQAAESNGIADTNQYLGDFYNTNVIAYYTNKAGDQQNIEVARRSVEHGRRAGHNAARVQHVSGRSDRARSDGATAMATR
jgi:Flp pilus assembly protein TadG